MERQSVVKMKEEEGQMCVCSKNKRIRVKNKGKQSKEFQGCSVLLLGCENRMCVGGTGKLMTDILFIV